MLTTRNTKIPSDTPEEEEPLLSPSPKNLAMPAVENGYVNESRPPPSDITKKSFLANDARSNKTDKKITFVNENRAKENGGLKMGNGKAKNMYQRRRTKQRADMLPEVMEVTVDVEDDFAEV